MACFSDCRLPVVLGFIAIRTRTDHEGSVGGLRSNCRFVTDFYATSARRNSSGCGALNDILSK